MIDEQHDNSYIVDMEMNKLKESARMVTFRLPTSYDRKFAYIKLMPGGFTRWVLDQIDKVELDEELMSRLEQAFSKTSDK